MKDLIAMQDSYANRSWLATPNWSEPTTFSGFALNDRSGRSRRMAFDRYDFLDRVRKKARNQKAVLDILELPSSRGTEVFDPAHPKPRRLKVEEAVALSEAFGVPIGGAGVSVSELVPVLTVCLRNAPPSWDSEAVQRLAEEIALGLRFQQSFGTRQQGPSTFGEANAVRPESLD